MKKEELSIVIGAVASDVGADAAYFRKDKDKLYFSGIEIAALVATGVLTSFFIGVFRGMKVRAGEVGEKLGKSALDVLIDKLFLVQSKATGRNLETKEDLETTIQELQDQLAAVAQQPACKELHIHIHQYQLETQHEVSTYLEQIGYPLDVLPDRSKLLCDRVEKEIEVL